MIAGAVGPVADLLEKHTGAAARRKQGNRQNGKTACQRQRRGSRIEVNGSGTWRQGLWNIAARRVLGIRFAPSCFATQPAPNVPRSLKKPGGVLFHPGQRCGSNSVGRVLASQASCRGFESRLPLSNRAGCRNTTAGRFSWLNGNLRHANRGRPGSHPQKAPQPIASRTPLKTTSSRAFQTAW